MYRHVVGHAHPQASPGAHQPRARIAPPARPRNLQGGQFLTRACMSRTRTRVHKFVRGAQSRCQHVCVSPATLTGKCCAGRTRWASPSTMPSAVCRTGRARRGAARTPTTTTLSCVLIPPTHSTFYSLRYYSYHIFSTLCRCGAHE